MIRYVDTHAHIFSKEFQSDFEDVLNRAKESHVDRVMIITLDNEETKKAIEFAKRDKDRYKVAAGIFPTDTDEVSEEYWNEFVELVRSEEVSCVGEIGLDYHWEEDEKKQALQREYFIKQIKLAKEVNKPILVHSRDAIQDTFDIMKEYKHHGLMHCYSGTKEMAKEFTKLGYYIALGGAITFKNARHAVEVCESIDEEYLLSETDCPYMSPEPKRGTRNEPCNIPLIVKKMAEVRGISEEDMAKVIDDNWTRFLEKLL